MKSNNTKTPPTSLSFRFSPQLRGIKGGAGFTLVELLVVITIIAILATLSFVSFQGFTRDARDATRLGQIDQIQKGLESYAIDNAVYPESNNPVSITASGTIISYQGTFSEQQSKLINMSPPPLDPLDKTEYTYLTTASKDKYQLLAFMEGKEYKQTAFINNPSLTLPLSLMEGNKAYAADYTNRYIRTKGNNLGIILDATTNQPITQTVDLFTTNSGTQYKVIINNKITKTGSGIDLGGGLQMISIKGGEYNAPKICPEGFIPVPGNEEFFQPGFCVARYEMALDRDLETSELNTLRNTWTGSTTSKGTGAVWQDGKIVSAAGKYPIANITQIQAIAACKSMGEGYHLITNNEWMTVARNIEKQALNWSGGVVGNNYIFNGVSGTGALGCDSNTVISGVAYTNGIYQLPKTRATKTGGGVGYSGSINYATICDTKRQLKLSNGQIIWDLSGNVYEHVNKANTIDGTNYNNLINPDILSINGLGDWTGSTIDNKNLYGPLVGINSTNGIGRINQADGTIFLRGGDANNTDTTGLFTLSLTQSTTSNFGNVGFRCTY